MHSIKTGIIVFAVFAGVNLAAQTTPQLYPYLKKNGTYIYVDKDLEPLIAKEYEEARPFIENLAVVKLNGKYGVIDEKGNTVVEARYSAMEDYSEGLAVVQDSAIRKYGAVNTSGSLILPLEYDWVCSAREGMLRVRQGDFLGFINTKGKLAIPCIYVDDFGDGAKDFNEGRSIVRVEGKYGAIDKTGKVVVECKYGSLKDFSEGIAAAELNGTYGFIDTKGTVVLKFIYTMASSFYSGRATVNIDTRQVIDKKGNIIISGYNCGNFMEGFAKYNNYGQKGAMGALWGYIDINGKTIVDLKYSEAAGFSEGMACIKLKGRYGYIDKTGKEVIAPIYIKAVSFKSDLAQVSENMGTKYFYIDKTGKEFREK